MYNINQIIIFTKNAIKVTKIKFDHIVMCHHVYHVDHVTQRGCIIICNVFFYCGCTNVVIFLSLIHIYF